VSSAPSIVLSVSARQLSTLSQREGPPLMRRPSVVAVAGSREHMIDDICLTVLRQPAPSKLFSGLPTPQRRRVCPYRAPPACRKSRESCHRNSYTSWAHLLP